MLDVQLPGVTGLKIARVLRKQHQNAKIVFLSMHVDDERLFDAIRAGASAFLTKDVDRRYPARFPPPCSRRARI